MNTIYLKLVIKLSYKILVTNIRIQIIDNFKLDFVRILITFLLVEEKEKRS